MYKTSVSVKVISSPCKSFSITFLLVKTASSNTVKLSATATAVSSKEFTVIVRVPVAVNDLSETT